MSTRTPKPRASLRSLEDVTTTARRKGAPKSFVFAEDESSESSSSESDNELPISKGASNRKVQASSRTKRNSSAPGDVEEQIDLVALLRDTRKHPVTQIAARWIARADTEVGVCELLSAFMKLAGATQPKVSKFIKSAKATLDNACENCEFENGSLIQQKSSEAKRIVNMFQQFFNEVGLSKNKIALTSAFECAQAASVSTARSLRQVGTSAAMNFGRGILKRADNLRRELERAQELFVSEVRDCESKIKNQSVKQKVAITTETYLKALDSARKAVCNKPPANEASISADDTVDDAVDTVQQAMDKWRASGKDGVLSDRARQAALECQKVVREFRACERKAFEGRDSVFYEVAKARFRDVDAQIRFLTAELLGDWSAAYPNAMSVPHRSKYLGWMLNDKSSHVRAEALRGLARLVAAEPENLAEIKARLEVFAARFLPRIRGMFLDIDPAVVMEALRLSQVLFKRELISKENDVDLLGDAEDLVFYAPERFDIDISSFELQAWVNVRQEAARLAEMLDVRLTGLSPSENQDDDMEEELTVTTRGRKGKKNATKSTVTKENPNEGKIRAFLDLVLRRIGTGDWAHLEAGFAFDAFFPQGEEERKRHFLADIDTLVSLFLDDNLSTKNVLIPRVLGAIMLRLMESLDSTAIVPESTLAMVQGSRPGRKAKRTKVSTEENSLGNVLYDLVVRYRSDEYVLERLIRIVPYVPDFGSQTDKILGELSAVCLEANLDELLEAAALSLSALSEEIRPERTSALATIDRLGKTASDRFRQHVLEGESCDTVDSISWIRRCACLASGTTLGENAVGGEDALRQAFILACRMNHASEALVLIIKLGLGAAAWHICQFVEGENVTEDAIAVTKRYRSALSETFKRSFELLSQFPSEDHDNDNALLKKRIGWSLRILEMFHDTRTLFWPGDSRFGWVPSQDLSDEADAVFTGIVVPGVENDPTAIRIAYDKVLIPMARTALYASPREDAKTASLVLRFASVAGEATGTEEACNNAELLRRCALRLNAELRKTDVDRWLQAHLETLYLDTDHSDALCRSLGAPSDKVAQTIGSAISGMVCRAIREAVSQQNEALLNAVSPYLAFCKQGSKPRERITRVWEQAKLSLNDDQFGAAFESKLNRHGIAGKRSRASNAGEGDAEVVQSASSSRSKKARASISSGLKRDLDLDNDNDGASPRKSARPLVLVQSGTGKRNPRKSQVTDETKELERSVFEANSDDEQDDGTSNKEEIDEFEDPNTTSAKRKLRTSQRSAAKKKLGNNDSVTSDESDSEDSDTEFTGFRPRLRA